MEDAQIPIEQAIWERVQWDRTKLSDDEVLSLLDSDNEIRERTSTQPKGIPFKPEILKESLYDEIGRRELKSEKAMTLLLAGIYREQRHRHALSACKSAIEIVFQAPQAIIDHVFSTMVDNQFLRLPTEVSHYDT